MTTLLSILNILARSIVDLALALAICGALFLLVVLTFDHLIPALCRAFALTC